MSLSLRLAGFEIRDTLQWLYGSGFPKSHNVSKALDKQAGGQGEVLHTETRYNAPNGHDAVGQGERTLVERVVRAPATEHAQQWEGWGTALKPAFEPVIMARKPLKGTVAQNTLEHGCGGINVDGCRVGDEPRTYKGAGKTDKVYSESGAGMLDGRGREMIFSVEGRWPANVILDPEAGALLDTQAGEPVSRFFYCAKASRAEREAGLQGHETKTGAQLTGRQEGSVGLSAYAGTRGAIPRANIHPTVKPINLMRYLVRLVTPSHGTVLDPFTGSGSTGCAAVLERVNFIGIERENEYARIATARIEYWATQAHADAPQADTRQADQPQADTPPADTPQANTPTVHKTPRGARHKAPAEDDPQGSLF
jgi:site-specific DNA-methyltransferase (adenine-specific)